MKCRGEECVAVFHSSQFLDLIQAFLSLASLIIANQKHIVLSQVQTMHCTQGPCVYRLKILHNHTSRHKVLILSVKYKQDKLRGFSPAIRMFHQKYIHMVCPISGEIPSLMMEDSWL